MKISVDWSLQLQHLETPLFANFFFHRFRMNDPTSDTDISWFSCLNSVQKFVHLWAFCSVFSETISKLFETFWEWPCLMTTSINCYSFCPQRFLCKIWHSLTLFSPRSTKFGLNSWSIWSKPLKNLSNSGKCFSSTNLVFFEGLFQRRLQATFQSKRV